MTSTFPAGLSFALALAAALGAVCDQAEAKKAPLQQEQEDAPADPAAGATQPKVGNATVIKGEFVESHDMLASPDDTSAPLSSGIQWSHNFVVTLSGGNHVTEKWRHVRVSPGSARGRRTRSVVTKSDEGNVTIGSSSGKAVWHVLGPNKLQRIFAGDHFLLMMSIEIDGDKVCHLEAKYLRQEGFKSVTLETGSSGGGGQADFSLPQVQSGSCSIE
jgi:hypothetical protein